MSMNGIDISSYQKGLAIPKVPSEFVIIKATEGTYQVQDTCDGWVQACIDSGKLWGFYHFGSAESPVEQAEFFVRHCKGYFGHGLPVYDYEMYGRIGADGAKRFLDRVHELTGVRCIVYMSRAVCTEEDWSEVAKDYALWVAQYANNDKTGYQGEPWLPSGGFGAWKSCAIHQYSSNGRLDGYSGALDLDIAHMTREAWGKFANPSGHKPANPPVPATPEVTGSTVELAAAVIRGEYGSGRERVDKLGSRYQEVQDEVNHILLSSADALAREVIAGKYSAGERRKEYLGERYDEVQRRVNGILGGGVRYTVKYGDTLWGIADDHGTTVAAIVAKNRSITDPNKIYEGQVLTI